IEVMKAANVAGNPWTRSLAMMNVAMFDAVNSVMMPKASAEPAAAAAARQMLLQLYPGQKTKIDEAYALSLKSIPEGKARTEGIALGEHIATALYTERLNDATNAPDTYRPVTTPGVWIPTV